MRGARTVVQELTLISLFAASCCVAYCQGGSPVNPPVAMPHAQATADPASSLLTLRVTSRLVYIDVTVRDSHGQFIRGLTQEDFKLFEDGHEQSFRLDVHSKDPAEGAAGTAKTETTSRHVAPLGQG